MTEHTYSLTDSPQFAKHRRSRTVALSYSMAALADRHSALLKGGSVSGMGIPGLVAECWSPSGSFRIEWIVRCSSKGFGLVWCGLAEALGEFR